jgi:hypothetical protein
LKNKTKMRVAVVQLAGLAWFGLSPKAHAVVPPPDGGYPGFNTAAGQNALFSRTTGIANTAVGWDSLFSNTDGSFNTALGTGTLLLNVGDQSTGDGTQNTAIGAAALLSNTAGSFNTAVGVTALVSNTTGDNNTAIGVSALQSNTVGNRNVAVGETALSSNTTGIANAAIGYQALLNNNGGGNTAIGFRALEVNTTGDDNTAIGVNALHNNTSGGFNVALGVAAGVGVTTASSVIAIGASGANVSNSCYIGNIWGATIDPANALVGVDSNGKLGTAAVSSRRFKRDIKPMDNASEAILALKPVTFHYKNDAKNIPCFGLVAEDVEKVNPHLIVRDKNGELLTVRYEQINAMLLNEFLKEHRKVQKLEAALDAITTRLEEQETELRKVRAQIQMNKPARRVASRD